MIIEGNSVPECWLEILKILVNDRKSELSPLIVKVNNTESEPDYRKALERDLSTFLESESQPRIETTAGTIFPESLHGGNTSIFDRYEMIWKHVKADRRNKRGTYFHRMVAWGDKNGERVNQLQHIIDTYNGIEGGRKPVHRRSALIATIFDPRIDHTPQPQLGFPCLQQVCFVPEKEAMLRMNAVYAMQHLSTRAYGNYLGLMRLGKFMASELGLNFGCLQCMISTLSLGEMKKSEARKIVQKYS